MISLNYRDSRPIHMQITEGIKRLIISGALSADEKLPSVRSLAVDLSINPNTIQRAYSELERDGYIYCVAGKGNFVSKDPGEAAAHVAQLKEELAEKIRELKYLGAEKDELLTAVEKIYKEEKHD
ncbi:MAG: GntR family transcriptional regulator [Lachnospiraceae bacterium]|nr:GntR family transcriptional regulator [Candidatus Minthocola equi]